MDLKNSAKSENKLEGEETENKPDIDETVCGFACFRPKWIQRLASPKVFTINFCIMGIFQGALFTYTVAVLTTLEKRYAFDSKTSGIILIADNFSGIFLSVLLGYWGQHINRPRWIGFSTLVVTLHCLICATPYFIYGPGLHLLEKSHLVEKNTTKYDLCDDLDAVEESCNAESTMTSVAVSLLFFAILILGFGHSACYTIGPTYIDDGIKKKNSALYLSLQMSLRFTGPSLGYVMASFCLSFYEDPFYDPGIPKEDPRFVGAWWMGYIVIGVILTLTGLPMLLFPKRLPGNSIKLKENNSKKLPSIKDIPKTFRILFANRVWLFHCLALVFHVNSFGYFMIMPRYVEHHFKKNASDASLFSGTSTMLTMVAGVLIGGLVISKISPRPRYLTAYISAISIFSWIAIICGMFLPCPQAVVAGNVSKDTGLLDLRNSCNDECQCTTKVYQPVCGPDGVTNYFSPCFAGCNSMTTNDSNTIFNECNCIDETDKSWSVSNGLCPFKCDYFLVYIVILSVTKMIASTGRVGSCLVIYRCVEQKYKDLSGAAMFAVIAVFGIIPYPLVFGAVADSTCLVWEEKCGKTGNCWVYDTDKLRNYLHLTALVFFTLATFFDFMVFVYSNSLKNFYEDELDDGENPKSKDGLLEKNGDGATALTAMVTMRTNSMNSLVGL